jgi:hypothetical protein
MVLQYVSNQLPRPCRLPFAKLLVSMEDDWGGSLATIVWLFLEDLGGQQWEGQSKEGWRAVPEEVLVSEWQ